jgi:hypothetical protein
MSSEFRENLDAAASFIEKTGGVMTTGISVAAIATTVIILSLNKIDLPAWGQVLLGVGGAGGIIYDPKKASVVQQQFQHPVDNVAVGTPSSGSMSNISETNFTSPAAYEQYPDHPPTERYLTTDGNNDEWLDPAEAAQRLR